MQIGGKKTASGRRRRVAAGSSKATGATRTSGNAALQAYTEDALRDAQPRITDFIPIRPFSLLVVFLIGFIPIAATTTLFVLKLTVLSGSSRLATAGLELYGRGTTATWLESMMMMAGAFLCLLIYNIRRHRTDDYRGSYGFWLWGAGFLVLLSVDCVAGFHYLLQGGFETLFHDVTVKYGARCWVGTVSLLTAGFALRAITDMRRNRLACICMVAGLACVVMSGLHRLNIYRVISGETGVLVMISLLLVGQYLAIFSLVIYSRYVFRVAQGDVKIVVRKRKKKAKKEPGERRGWFRRGEKSAKSKKTKSSRKPKRKAVEIDEDDYDADDEEEQVTKPKTTTRRRATVPLPEEDADEDSEDEMDILTNPNLTKAERRKLRKKFRRKAA